MGVGVRGRGRAWYVFLNLIGRYLVFSHSHRDLDTNNSPHRSQTMNVVCKLRGRGERWIGGGDLSRRGGRGVC